MKEQQSVIEQAAKQGSSEIFGYEEGDYTIDLEEKLEIINF